MPSCEWGGGSDYTRSSRFMEGSDLEEMLHVYISTHEYIWFGYRIHGVALQDIKVSCPTKDISCTYRGA